MKRVVYGFLVVGLVGLVWVGSVGRSGEQVESPCQPQPWYFSADVNSDNQLDLSDPIYLLNYMFLGGSAPRCLAEEITFCDPCKGLFITKGELNSIHPPMVSPGFYPGLDADRLDGRNGEDFASSNHTHPFDPEKIEDQSIPLDKLTEPAATLTNLDAMKQELKDELDKLRNEIPLAPTNVPLGAVIAWLKSFPNNPGLPINFVECNGQVLDDPDSRFHWQSIPNLNGSGGQLRRFLRGSTNSGATGGSEEHVHSVPRLASCGVAGGDACLPNLLQAASSLPSYYEVVWIIRVK